MYNIDDQSYDRYYILKLDSNDKASCYSTLKSYQDSLAQICTDGNMQVVDIYGIE